MNNATTFASVQQARGSDVTASIDGMEFKRSIWQRGIAGVEKVGCKNLRIWVEDGG